jgi:hypothetical protein
VKALAVMEPSLYTPGVDKAFTIYLPDGNVSTNVYDPTKSLRELINRLTSTRYVNGGEEGERGGGEGRGEGREKGRGEEWGEKDRGQERGRGERREGVKIHRRNGLEANYFLRSELLNVSYTTTDLKGEEVPLSMTQAEVVGHKICYGTDILEWYGIFAPKFSLSA